MKDQEERQRKNRDFDLLMLRLENLMKDVRELQQFARTMYNRSNMIGDISEAVMNDIIDPKESSVASRTYNALKAAGYLDMHVVQFIQTVSHNRVKMYRNVGNAVIKYIQKKIKTHTGYDWNIRTDRDRLPQLVKLYEQT